MGRKRKGKMSRKEKDVPENQRRGKGVKNDSQQKRTEINERVGSVQLK